MIKAEPEVVWAKLKAAKPCYVLITELDVHPMTRGINCQDFIPNEINLNSDIWKHNTIFSEYSQNSVRSKNFGI
jgi:ABC-type Fe3+-citrate transport system substrate-binding protein